MKQARPRPTRNAPTATVTTAAVVPRRSRCSSFIRGWKRFAPPLLQSFPVLLSQGACHANDHQLRPVGSGPGAFHKTVRSCAQRAADRSNEEVVEAATQLLAKARQSDPPEFVGTACCISIR